MKTGASFLAVIEANPHEDLVTIRQLFKEYAGSIEIDLCFQNLEGELAELPGKYAPPGGRLLLGLQTGEPAGCVALRPLTADICEMKRLYVRPGLRGRGLGRMLAARVIKAGCEIGYERMRLDTLASMKEAIALYEALGFRRIQPYYHNPSPIAVFMELNLRGAV